MPKILINYKSHNFGYLYLFLFIGDIEQVFKIRKISKLFCRDLEKILKKIIGLINVSDQIDGGGDTSHAADVCGLKIWQQGTTAPSNNANVFQICFSGGLFGESNSTR
jgi:hypothetical protein